MVVAPTTLLTAGVLEKAVLPPSGPSEDLLPEEESPVLFNAVQPDHSHRLARIPLKKQSADDAPLPGTTPSDDRAEHTALMRQRLYGRARETATKTSSLMTKSVTFNHNYADEADAPRMSVSKSTYITFNPATARETQDSAKKMARFLNSTHFALASDKETREAQNPVSTSIADYTEKVTETRSKTVRAEEKVEKVVLFPQEEGADAQQFSTYHRTFNRKVNAERADTSNTQYLRQTHFSFGSDTVPGAFDTISKTSYCPLPLPHLPSKLEMKREKAAEAVIASEKRKKFLSDLDGEQPDMKTTNRIDFQFLSSKEGHNLKSHTDNKSFMKDTHFSMGGEFRDLETNYSNTYKRHPGHQRVKPPNLTERHQPNWREETEEGKVRTYETSANADYIRFSAKDASLSRGIPSESRLTSNASSVSFGNDSVTSEHYMTTSREGQLVLEEEGYARHDFHKHTAALHQPVCLGDGQNEWKTSFQDGFPIRSIAASHAGEKPREVARGDNVKLGTHEVDYLSNCKEAYVAFDLSKAHVVAKKPDTALETTRAHCLPRPEEGPSDQFLTLHKLTFRPVSSGELVRNLTGRKKHEASEESGAILPSENSHRTHIPTTTSRATYIAPERMHARVSRFR